MRVKSGIGESNRRSTSRGDAARGAYGFTAEVTAERRKDLDQDEARGGSERGCLTDLWNNRRVDKRN
jgi:hypothetical protein